MAEYALAEEFINSWMAGISLPLPLLAGRRTWCKRNAWDLRLTPRHGPMPQPMEIVDFTKYSVKFTILLGDWLLAYRL
jgi:hypothetical protein